MTLLEQLPPHSIEAEENVIGSILIDLHALERVRPLLLAGDFYIVKHQWIYAAALNLAERHIPIDFTTITHELSTRGQLAELGGPVYLSSLINGVPTAIHAEGYAQIVRTAAQRRGLLQAASQAAQRAYAEDESIDEQIMQMIVTLRELQTRGLRQAMSARDAAQAYHEQVREWIRNPLEPGDVRGLSFGFDHCLDFTSGYDPGDLVVMAGRPAMGKSALGFQIAYNVARQRRRAVVFSLEMTRDQVVERLAGGLSRIERRQVREGHLTDPAWQQYTEALMSVGDLDLYLHDAPAMSTSAIAAITLELAPDLIVIDHLGRIGEPSAQKNEIEAKRIGRITKNLKTLAKDAGAVVLLLVQLNRAVESRNDKRPTLSDLRDSGEIEEDADAVLMVYRDDYYNPDTVERHVTEIIPRKLRNGDVDAGAELKFIPSVAWFERLEPPLNERL